MISFLAAIWYSLFSLAASQGDYAMANHSSPSAWGLSEEKIISPEDVKRILSTARTHSERDYVFFTVAANTGLRLAEVGHLMADEILDGNRLLVTRRKKKHLKPEIIDVAAPVHALLRDWAKQFEVGWLFPGDCAPCFIRHLKGEPEQFCIGGHSSLRDVQRRWSMVLAECGLLTKGRGIHSLRHAAITAFYAKTRDLRAAQMFAGHSSSQITERYAHVTEMREKINSVEVLL